MTSSHSAAAQPSPSAGASPDRYTFGWLVAFLVWLLLFFAGSEFDLMWNRSGAIGLLTVLAALPLLLCWLIAAIVHVARRRWQRVVSTLAAPFMASMLFAVLSAAGVSAEGVRFALNKRFYQDEIARLPRTGEPRFHRFAWGENGSGIGGPNIFFTLIYDETDELGLDPDQRSDEWRTRMTPPSCLPEQQCAVFESAGRKTVTIKPMGGHFFLMTELYQ